MIPVPDRPGYVQKCPECYNPAFRPYSLQQFAADVEADEPGYGAAIHAENEARQERQRADDREAARRGVLEGMANNCPMWMIRQFEDGYTATDEPPGFEDRAYRMWREAGGVVKTKTVTADDL